MKVSPGSGLTFIMEEIVKRWHQEKDRTVREWKKHRKVHTDSNKNSRGKVGVSAYVVDCICDEQIGRFRKKDAYDCGNPRCWMCHNDKFPKREKTRQELLADKKLEEYLND